MREGLKVKPTQCQQIIRYMRQMGSISSYEAYAELGITQLAARLKNLEDKGYTFSTKRATKVRPDGSKVSYCIYSIAKEGQAI